MASSRTSLDLLAHFDAPKLDESSRATIGVTCVLKWAAALGVLFFAACILLQLAYCIAAERTLAHAARAGALEATLPRATRDSITATIQRPLARRSISLGALRIAIQQNHAPLPRVFRLADDDHVSVVLSLPSDAVLPPWLHAMNSWTGNPLIRARAEQQIPGRRITTGD